MTFKNPFIPWEIFEKCWKPLLIHRTLNKSLSIRSYQQLSMMLQLRGFCFLYARSHLPVVFQVFCLLVGADGELCWFSFSSYHPLAEVSESFQVLYFPFLTGPVFSKLSFEYGLREVNVSWINCLMSRTVLQRCLE